MGIFDYLLGSSDRDQDDAQPPPQKAAPALTSTKDGTKHSRRKTPGASRASTDPDTDSFKEEHAMMLPTTRDKTSQECLRERERRHINREDDPHFDPTDKTDGDKIPGADQAPNHEVKSES